MTKTTAEISSWLTSRIAYFAETGPENIDVDADISVFRIDSLLMVNITTELGEWMEMEINPTILWEMRTIAATSEWIADNQED